MIIDKLASPLMLRTMTIVEGVVFRMTLALRSFHNSQETDIKMEVRAFLEWDIASAVLDHQYLTLVTVLQSRDLHPSNDVASHLTEKRVDDS